MQRRTRLRLAFVLAAALAAGVLGGGCGEKKKVRATPALAARVDGQAIMQAEVERVLEQQQGLRPQQQGLRPQQQGLRPQQREAAGRQVLARLIDQRLLAAQARRLELDRDPRVRERIEAATREILARAYADRLDDQVQPPGAAGIEAYYRAHPERFAQRRVYTLQELAIEAGPEQIEALRGPLQDTLPLAELLRELQARDLRFSVNHAVRAAEQLPAQALQMLAALRAGQSVLLPTPKGVLRMTLLDARSEPLAPAQARAMIEASLLAEGRRKLLQEALQAVRAKARIEYAGPFAAAAHAPQAEAEQVPAHPAVETTAHKDPP